MADPVTMHLRHWRLSVALFSFLTLMFLAASAIAAPFAAVVMDARTGEILYEKNGNARLHPASLTKMLTLYIAFEAIEHGEVSLDTMVTVSSNAAGQAPSRLGLRPGQKIALRYLIRAAAIKSANDAAMAIGEAISGSQANFSKRMNRTAKALGMKNSTFANPNGLTASGHLSTAMDMSILGRRLFYDFPQYYGLFSRRTVDAGMAPVANTNRKFLDAYEGADGIKTGYTAPAGFNLTASAQRGGVRIITTVFGGTSTAQRNAKVAELMDLGFARAPKSAEERAPAKPAYAPEPMIVAEAPVESAPVEDTIALQVASSVATSREAPPAAKTIRVTAAPSASPRPTARPSQAAAPAEAVTVAQAGSDADSLAGVETTSVDAAVLAALEEEEGPATSGVQETAGTLGDTITLAEAAAAEAMLPESMTSQAAAPAAAPVLLAAAPSAESEIVQAVAQEAPEIAFVQTSTPQPETVKMAEEANQVIFLAAAAPAPAPATREVSTRASTSGGRGWGVNVGKFNSSYDAEKMLMKTALLESATLDEATRKVVNGKSGWMANFTGLTREDAELACHKLAARGTDCAVIGG